MKIGGFGELENIRRAAQKEPARPAAAASGTREGGSAAGDEVQISAQAKILGKLRQIPDIRQEKIDQVLAKMNDGTLMTSKALKESVAEMLKGIL